MTSRAFEPTLTSPPPKGEMMAVALITLIIHTIPITIAMAQIGPSSWLRSSFPHPFASALGGRAPMKATCTATKMKAQIATASPSASGIVTCGFLTSPARSIAWRKPINEKMTPPDEIARKTPSNP